MACLSAGLCVGCVTWVHNTHMLREGEKSQDTTSVFLLRGPILHGVKNAATLFNSETIFFGTAVSLDFFFFFLVISGFKNTVLCLLISLSLEKEHLLVLGKICLGFPLGS